MQPIGKLPITFALGTKTYTDEFHIYPEVTGVLLSRKAAKGLNILPDYYHHTEIAHPHRWENSRGF